jgi:hypothetical protein
MSRTPSLTVALALSTLVAAAMVVAQPPRVRQPDPKRPETKPEAKQPEARQPELLPDRGEVPPDPDWPRTRSPGSQRYEGRLPRMQPRITQPPQARIRPGRPSRWYLGVYDERAPQGTRLSQIVPGSPASRFGLEVGDYILDVGGYVVGDYNGSYYPLSLALEYGTDRSGWAELLVWNKRTFAEETLWVQLRRR